MGGWMGVTIVALSRKDTVLARIAKFSQYGHNLVLYFLAKITHGLLNLVNFQQKANHKVIIYQFR